MRVISYLILTTVSGWLAFVMFNASAPNQQPTGTDVTPDMLLLTSERAVAVNVVVSYFQWYQSTAEGLTYGPEAGSLPTGVREVQLQFLNGKPDSTLQYSVLLGRNGTENDPVGLQNEQIFSGTPGGTYSSDCVNTQTAGIFQVIYGKVHLNMQGQAAVITVGKLVNQHAYLEDGASDDVGVIDVNSPITALSASGPGGTCIFPDWPYLGGVLWYSPSSLGGEVSIGPVANEFNVSSSNPPLTDLSSLSWQINGPTSVNYTLTDNNDVHRQLRDSFIAGVLAALAAALFVEAAKSALDKAAESDGQEPAPIGRTIAEKHPILTGAIVVAAVGAVVRRRRPGN
jgi:hypothetical protein